MDREQETSMTSTAVKHDKNKPDFTYISYEMMEALAKVRAFGETKYSRDNWKLGGPNWIRRNLAACARHIWKHLRGEVNDEESGLPHLWHAACCLEHAIYEQAKTATNLSELQSGLDAGDTTKK